VLKMPSLKAHTCFTTEEGIELKIFRKNRIKYVLENALSKIFGICILNLTFSFLLISSLVIEIMLAELPIT
jgi:hypothetical protein